MLPAEEKPDNAIPSRNSTTTNDMSVELSLIRYPLTIL
jgi:hypothetical protein